jgi:aspartate/methionine/tyrosine aminotransferase
LAHQQAEAAALRPEKLREHQEKRKERYKKEREVLYEAHPREERNETGQINANPKP